MSAPRPVIVGVAETANRDDDRIVHPVELLEAAARAALDDVGAAVAARIGAVYATPMSVFNKDNGGAIVAEILGLAPGPRVESRFSGAGSGRLLAAACDEVAEGRIDAALIVGGIADASVRRAERAGVDAPAPPTSVWSQGSGRPDLLERARPLGVQPATLAEAHAGAMLPSAYFALAESILAHESGRDPAAQRAWLGELLAPFTAVAAARPDVAWFPTERSGAELAVVHEGNRLIAEPYTKSMCSFPTVDQAAAVVVVSDALAAELGIPAERRVYPRAAAMVREPGSPATRVEMHRSAALTAAGRRAFAAAGIASSDVDWFDLYSCFPAAVQICADALGVGVDGGRPLTVTGGLAYHGGPGAAYGVHATAAMVERCRTQPDGIGAMVGLGGLIDDFAVVVMSSRPGPGPWTSDAGDDVTAELASAAVPISREASGEGIVEAMTVLHDRESGPVAAPAIVRLTDGSRAGARVRDRKLPAELAGTSLVGATVTLETDADGRVRYEPK